MKKFKKIALLVATAAMVFGATASVFAASDEVSPNIRDLGYADFYVYASSSFASAETATFTPFTALFVTAEADLSVTVNYTQVVDGETVSRYYTDSDSDYMGVTDTSADAMASFNINKAAVTSVIADSSHAASIDGVGVSADLSIVEQ